MSGRSVRVGNRRLRLWLGDVRCKDRGTGDAAGIKVAAQALQVRAQFTLCLIAKVAIFFKGLAKDALELGGQVGIEPDQRLR